MSDYMDSDFHGCDDCRGDGRPSVEPPGASVSAEPFTREDVAEMVAERPGYPDGDSSLFLGTLKDGRWFFVSSWEDYSGHG